jgi:hypothetical protein
MSCRNRFAFAPRLLEWRSNLINQEKEMDEGLRANLHSVAAAVSSFLLFYFFSVQIFTY